jgi:hypothetical protein
MSGSRCNPIESDVHAFGPLGRGGNGTCAPDGTAAASRTRAIVTRRNMRAPASGGLPLPLRAG